MEEKSLVGLIAAVLWIIAGCASYLFLTTSITTYADGLQFVGTGLVITLCFIVAFFASFYVLEKPDKRIN